MKPRIGRTVYTVCNENITKTKVLHYYVKTETEIDVCLCCQKDVDYYQNILNQLQNDLEVLKEYE